MDYDGQELHLKSGEKILSSVEIAGGGALPVPGPPGPEGRRARRGSRDLPVQQDPRERLGRMARRLPRPFSKMAL